MTSGRSCSGGRAAALPLSAHRPDRPQRRAPPRRSPISLACAATQVRDASAAARATASAFCCVVRSPRDDRKGPDAGRDARQLIEDDARYFLHQAASTPGLSAVRRAEGIWVEEIGGRRFMDFHGNSVHHLGYSHPRLDRGLEGPAGRPDVLAPPFHQRRRRHPRAAARGPGAGAPRQGPAGAVRQRRDGDRAPARAGGDRALQDGLVLGRLSRRGARGVGRRRRAGVPLGRERPAAGRHRARRPADMLPVPLRLPRAGRAAAPRRVPADVRPFRALRAREGGRRGGGRRRADPLDRLRATAGLLGGGAGGVRRARRAPRLRRGPERARQDGTALRVRALRCGPRHRGPGEGARRRHPPARGGDRAAETSTWPGTSPSATTRTRRTRSWPAPV